ncbi:MAG: hypothetical protein E7262_11100 [Lachnospiraceae bacterium]|nr:hypothetical protein [Lachnospiraceae bacterium]
MKNVILGLPELQKYIKSQTVNNTEAYTAFINGENILYNQILNMMNSNGCAEDKEEKTCIWNREQILTMTDTSMAAVLGEKYKEVDNYSVRARMPLPPFLFASRIVEIDAEFGELKPSSIAAEYDFEESGVFGVGDNKISYLLPVEASHIGIFLMGYMGLDVISNGTLSFRALDNAQTFYSGKPFRVGDTMKTIFKIHRFAQNGSTTIMYYTYETYNGDELVSISEASGGFFTKAELESNKGIVTPKLRFNPLEPKELLHFSHTSKTSYTDEETHAFYKGNYEACFGNDVKLSLAEKYYIRDAVKMIDRVTNIDYNGGKYGRGIICGEKNITPDMWPFEVHFKNDPVFPGIIMVDGVLQLEMFLFGHTGMLGHYNNAEIKVVEGACVKSKFRGQVRKGYSLLRYEVHIKECVQKEDGIFVLTEASIYNNDVHVIQVDNYEIKIYEKK